ncbi:MAG: alpha-ketoacid dehydrogenase subunit beta [Chloroflexi bacterium]|nr:alpha-ketoacid dehydrogenase subunit beta [Chloroflexota bacterium]
MRKLSFCDALLEATRQEMERDPAVFVYGIGVPDHKKIFGSTAGLLEQFGPDRCFDTPLCEETMTGFGLGAAIGGMRPIHIHIRVDFLLLAMNQLVNMISTYAYSTGGNKSVPMVIRVVVGRGWGQGYQHSKTLHSWLAHIPGLKVVMPTTPRDAKGLLTSAIRDDNPVVFIEHRWLYWAEEDVPEEPFTIPIGESKVIQQGEDITIVATSWMNIEALKAAEVLGRRGVSVEIVDPRTITPLDDSLIVESVNKTRHCIVADIDWLDYGFSAEVATRVYEKSFKRLKSPITRIGFAHTPCPTGRVLENEFYPNAIDIIRAIENKLGLSPTDLDDEEFYSHERRFKGPF